MTVELITRYVRVLIGFVLLWLGMYAYNNYGCRKLEGSEMEPLMARDNFRWIYPTVRKPSDLAHDDVIVYTYVVAGRAQQTVGARVVGLPGDLIKIEKGKVKRNGQLIGSAYVQPANESQDDFEEIIVPRDSVFVLCDNRGAYRYSDSRGIGPVGPGAIIGKIK
jgi:signal peptidase I